MTEQRSSNKAIRFLNYLARTPGIENKAQLVRAAARNSGTFTIQGRHIIVDSEASLHAFIKIFTLKEYDFDFTFTPKTIIDAGSNVGYASVYYKMTYPDSTIIAIEPETANFNKLKRNVRKFDDVFLEKAGLWDKDSFLEIENADSGDSLGFRVVEVETESENSIAGSSIPSLMEKYSIDEIDILKMDIEGSEYQLLTKGYKKWLPKVKVLVAELHEDIHDDITDIVADRADEMGFSLSEKGENVILYRPGLLNEHEIQ